MLLAFLKTGKESVFEAKRKKNVFFLRKKIICEKFIGNQGKFCSNTNRIYETINCRRASRMVRHTHGGFYTQSRLAMAIQRGIRSKTFSTVWALVST